MSKKIEKLLRYIEKAINTKLTVADANTNVLPLIISGRYDFVVCTREDGFRFVLAYLKGNATATIRQIIRSCSSSSQLLNLPIICAFTELERYKRARLRAQHFNFIVLDTEVHLPDMGIVQTAYATSPKPIRNGIGLAAQRILLAHMNHLFSADITITSVHHLFGFSKVTTIAAFDELERAGIALRESLVGRRGQRLDFRPNGRALWDKVRPLLKTPVRAKIGLDELPDGFTFFPSGETALASQSMLNPPEQAVFAFYGSAAEVALLKKRAVANEDGKYLIELWKHPPLLPRLSKLDPLSTIITTLDIANDERVAGEQDEILENFKW